MDHLNAVLQQFSFNKTPGCDNIDGKILYRDNDRLKEMLFNLINTVLHTGIMSYKLMLLDIIPLHKELTGE